jgi:hypothetical protein
VPAAAVIPAPGAYTKVVVVKKLVVVVVFGGSYLVVAVRRLTRVPYRHLARPLACGRKGPITVNKRKRSKQARPP